MSIRAAEDLVIKPERADLGVPKAAVRGRRQVQAPLLDSIIEQSSPKVLAFTPR
jgi:hypothetical protein